MTLGILNQRGQALAYTAIALVALTGLTFLAINVAYVAFVASEAQAAADAIATYGANVLADGITEPGKLSAKTDAFAPQNSVAGQPLSASEVKTDRGYYDIVNNTFGTSLPSGQVWNAVHATVTKDLTGSGFFAAQWLPYWSFVAPTTLKKEAYALMPAPSPGCNPATFKSDLPIGLGDCAVEDNQSFAAVPDGLCHPLDSWTTIVGCKDDKNNPNTQKKLAWWAGYTDELSCIDGRDMDPTKVDGIPSHFPYSATCPHGVAAPRGYAIMSTTTTSPAKNELKDSNAACLLDWITTNGYTTDKDYNIGLFDCTTLWNAEWCDQSCYSGGASGMICTYKSGVAYPVLSGCAVVNVLGPGTVKKAGDSLNIKVLKWTAVGTPGAGEARTGGVRSRLLQPTPVS
jgi:hypothetical protein